MGYRPDWNNTNFKKGSVRGFADGGDVDNREANRDDYFATKASEPTVDTYEFGRYDEMQENKDRYDREESARKIELDQMQQEAMRERSTIANVKDESPKPVSRSAPKTQENDTARLLARESAVRNTAPTKPVEQPKAQPARRDSGLRFGGGGAKKSTPKIEVVDNEGFDAGAAGGNVGNPEPGKYFQPPRKPTIRRGQAKNYK